MRVLYVPLDERACNLNYPKILAGMTGEVDLLTPPAQMLGKLKKPADVETLWAWVMEEAEHCDAAILSVDMLVYGNLVNSRTHHKSMETCSKLLGNFRTLKANFPHLAIHAFALVTRVAGYNSDMEDPDYWAYHGRSIWRYAWLMDKKQRAALDEQEQKELLALETDIPAVHLQDFLSRRKVNRQVVLSTVEMLGEGVFADLVVPKDDTAEYGYAAMDQRAISEKVLALDLMHKVMVYPGADEVGCVLLSRVFCQEMCYMPRIQVRYSSLAGPTIVPLYEDRPLHESIKAQIASAGGVLVDSAVEADLLLAVHSPGIRMMEAAAQETRDVTYYSHHCMHEFFRYIRYFTEQAGKACALADVCYANGSDDEMMRHAKAAGILADIDAYGGWNTAMNTVGVALAHGIIAAYLRSRRNTVQAWRQSQTFLVQKIIEDWFYQANIFCKAVSSSKAVYGKHIDPTKLGADEEWTREQTLKILRERVEAAFPEGFSGYAVNIKDISFPWGRLFDIYLDIELE